MKTNITGEMKVEKQLDLSLNKLLLYFDLPEVGISAKCELKTEKGNVIDNVNESCVIQSEKIVNDKQLFIKGDDDSYTKITKYQLALLATQIVFGAIQSVTEDGLVPIVGYVNEKKDELRKYQQRVRDWERETEKEKNYLEELERQREIDKLVDERVRKIVESYGLQSPQAEAPKVSQVEDKGGGGYTTPQTQSVETKEPDKPLEPSVKHMFGTKMTVHNELPKRKKGRKSI